MRIIKGRFIPPLIEVEEFLDAFLLLSYTFLSYKSRRYAILSSQNRNVGKVGKQFTNFVSDFLSCKKNGVKYAKVF